VTLVVFGCLTFMAQTPRHLGGKVDRAIDSLNAHWELRLPRLHGEDAVAAEDQAVLSREGKTPDLEEEAVLLARKCSSRIRYLCFRPVNLDSVLAEFEEDARHIHSAWVFKPSQERGTLPALPITKSFIAKEFNLKNRTHPITLSTSQRLMLLKKLDSVLEDEYQLAKASDSYERTAVHPSFVWTDPAPAGGQVAAPSRSKTGREVPGIDEPGEKHPDRVSRKRSAPFKDEASLSVSMI